MWYRFGQQLTLEKDFTGTSLGDIVKNAINNWLENSPYWQIYRNHNAYLVYKQIEYVAKEKGDMATKKLMQALNTVMLYDNNDASFKNLLEECADHPAVKQIAQKYGFTEPSRSFYSYESMQDIVNYHALKGVVVHKDQKEEYERPMRKFMEHLNNISNNDPIVPEVEREMDHNLINQFFPVEERTKTAKCKNVV